MAASLGLLAPVIAPPSCRPAPTVWWPTAAIDADEFYDYLLAHSPKFVASRRAAEERFACGEYGQPLLACDRLAEDAPNLDIKTIAGAAPSTPRQCRCPEQR